jgi:hypothetical protein
LGSRVENPGFRALGSGFRVLQVSESA